MLLTELHPDRELRVLDLAGQHLQACSKPWLGTPHALWGEGTRREWLLMRREDLSSVESGHTAAGLQLTGQRKEKPRETTAFMARYRNKSPFRWGVPTNVPEQLSTSLPQNPGFPNQEASATSNCFSKELVHPLQTSSSKEKPENIQVPH